MHEEPCGYMFVAKGMHNLGQYADGQVLSSSPDQRPMHAGIFVDGFGFCRSLILLCMRLQKQVMLPRSRASWKLEPILVRLTAEARCHMMWQQIRQSETYSGGQTHASVITACPRV